MLLGDELAEVRAPQSMRNAKRQRGKPFLACKLVPTPVAGLHRGAAGHAGKNTQGRK
jgi:hypothetical protein